jgi:flagellar secretion chaperone FliS
MNQAEVNRSYRESEIRGASSVDCAIMFYDVLIADLRKAIQCLAEGDIEGRTNALGHSLLVLGQLQGTLQMESGGDAAKHLYRFYSLARAKILEAQIKCRAQLLEEIVESVLKVREMWVEVREGCTPAATPEPWAVPSEEMAANSAWSA